MKTIPVPETGTDRDARFPANHNTKLLAASGTRCEMNIANSRNRRVFTNARAAATRNRNDALMKHLSAPIRVQGRYWGGLRLAYRFE